ncbi:MAG: SURF1 family protein [Longimicrobiaceae bacterium]
MVKVTPRGVLAGLAVLLVAAACVRLGFWQLGRLEERREGNARVEAALREPPVYLDAATAEAVRQDPTLFAHRRALVRGSYLASDPILLRGRFFGGRPGVHVVAPLKVAGSEQVVLVNRGWFPAPDGARPVEPVPPPPTGSSEARGLLQPVPRAREGGEPVRHADGTLTRRRLDLEALAGVAGGNLLPLYLQLRPGPVSVNLPIPVPPPELDEGPHLSYAVQWFSFALIALAGFGVVVWRRSQPSPTPPRA